MAILDRFSNFYSHHSKKFDIRSWIRSGWAILTNLVNEMVRAIAVAVRSCRATITNLVNNMKTSKIVKYFTNQPISKKGIRLGILVLAGCAGMALSKYWSEPILDFLDIAKTDMAKTDDNASSYPANVRGYFALPILSFFVFIALWFFRTYDTRQKIQQTNFTEGLGNLVSDNPLQVDIGVFLLLEVSKATSAFDKEIRLAFIKRLKMSPKEFKEQEFQDGLSNRLSYAQYILPWLINNPKESSDLKLNGINCEYQEFTANRYSSDALEMVKLLPKTNGGPPKKPDTSSGDSPVHLPIHDFRWADCRNINFKNVNLCAFDFRGAKNVDMRGGYIMDRSRPPLGVDHRTLSEYIEHETGKVTKNPPVVINDS